MRGGTRSSGGGGGGSGSGGGGGGGGVAGVLVLLEAEELEAVELALGSSEPRVACHPPSSPTSLPLPPPTSAYPPPNPRWSAYALLLFPPSLPPSPARQARYCVSVLIASGGGDGDGGSGGEIGSGGGAGVGVRELRTARALILNPPPPHVPAAPSAAACCLLRRAQEQFGSPAAAAPLPRAATSVASGGTWQHPADRGGGFGALPLDGFLAEVGVRLAEPWAAPATIRSVHAKLAAVDVVDSTSLAAALNGGHGGLNALLRERGHSALCAETLAVCSRLLRTQSYCLE